jgi:outer membrane protein TolC
LTAARLSHLLLLSAAATVSGCARYEGKPLTRETVEQTLAPPDAQSLRVATASLKHPILQPLDVDPSRGLSPEEAAVVAVIVNPELRAERDRRGVAAAQLLQAGLLPNPSLTAGLDFPYDSEPPDNFTAYNVGLDWEVAALIAREQHRRAAAEEQRSVALDVAWKEWQVAQEARTAAYDVLALEQQLAAARDAEQQATENRDAVRRFVDRHEKTLLDLTAAETSAQEAHALVVTSANDLTHRRLALNRALGLAAGQTVKVRASADVLPSRLAPPGHDDLLVGLEDRRLDLLALRRGYESQDAKLRAAILAQFPKLSLGLNAARDTSNVKTIGIGATLDLPLFDRNQGNIAIERATRQQLFDEYAARVFAARADIAGAIADIDAANAELAAAADATAGLERLVRTLETALQAGNVDILSYYEARGTLYQKRLDVIKLRQQLVDNWIALELASGQYLPLGASAATSATTQEARR